MTTQHRGLVHFSQKANLAIHALIYLYQADRLVDAGVMADDMGVSRTHLAKVLGLLANEGLVQSIRGRNGGVRLDKAVGRLSLLDVLKAMEEPVEGPYCLLGKPVTKENQCALVDVLDQVNALLQQALSGIKLDEFRPCAYMSPAKNTTNNNRK